MGRGRSHWMGGLVRRASARMTIRSENDHCDLRRILWSLLVCLAPIAPWIAGAAEDLPLEYRWEEGSQYQCTFQVTATVADSRERVTGVTIYTPLPGEPATPSLADGPSEWTGTAFLVSADGILVTCAHVVEGAITIEVHLGKKVYSAKVLAYNSDIDLAVLKITARNLPYLQFCDSDLVQLAQEVRVVGYPLSDVLGESVKISRGTISGIIKKEDENRFQIDARVNPGNSGGPLVDRQGRVVGVASELLTSQAIDSIGFAIPSNEAMTLLRKQGVRFTLPRDGANLDGPDLAKRVIPAVALLRVKAGPGGVAARKLKALRFTGVYHTADLLGSRPNSESGKLIIDSCGRIISFDGGEMVPFLFESLGTMGMEKLSGNDRKTWKLFRPVTLTLTAAAETPSRLPWPFYHRPPSYRYRHYDPPSYRYPGPPSSRYRFPGPPDSRGRVETAAVKPIPAIEEVEYKRLSQSAAGTVMISKKYHFYTVKKEDDGTRLLDLQTQGTVTWDKQIGWVKQSHMKGQITLNQSNITIRVPLEMQYDFVKQKATKPDSRRTPSPKGGTKPRLAGGATKQPPARKVEPPADGTKRSSLQTAPSSTGLSKFNPNDGT